MIPGLSGDEEAVASLQPGHWDTDVEFKQGTWRRSEEFCLGSLMCLWMGMSP